MKTHVLSQKQTFTTFSFIGLMIMTLLAFNPLYGQTKVASTTETITNERTIKGIVSDAKAPLATVNVIQKGTRNGTVTNDRGEFTFPVKLKTGDVLVFSYLGYIKQEVVIKANTTFITVVLEDAAIEMIGALDSAKPYKSKRKN